MNLDAKNSSLAAAIAVAIGITTGTLSSTVSAATLADGFYDMVINNTPYSAGSGYDFGSDGAWNSSFTFGAPPNRNSYAMYDDTNAFFSRVNGKYAGNPNDGVQGTVSIKVEGGVITSMGLFEFDMIPNTAGGNFVEYGDPTAFTGSIDTAGNISLTATGILGAVEDFPSLVDERWNVDNFNGGVGSGTNFVANPPNSNTTYDSFSTGSATNTTGTINGAAYDGTAAILVKGGTLGSDWGGFFGAEYFEVWNVSFECTSVPPLPGQEFNCAGGSVVPIPAAAWLFGSGLLGLVGIAKRKKSE